MLCSLAHLNLQEKKNCHGGNTSEGHMWCECEVSLTLNAGELAAQATLAALCCFELNANISMVTYSQ